jgi:signal transduction histidine kinase/DNA-binding response OmpR family regulator
MLRITERLARIKDRVGLTWKLILHFLWILIALATTLTWYSLREERALLLTELRLRHTAQTNYWIQNNLLHLISPDPAALAGLTRDLLASSDVAYVVLYDAQGKPVVTTGPEASRVTTRPVNLQQLDDQSAAFDTVTSAGARFYEMSLPIVLPQGATGGIAAAISPLTGLMPEPAGQPARPEILGAVRLGVSAASVNAKMQAIRNKSIALAAAIVFLALTLSYWLMRRSTRPIKEVARQATAIANGDFERTPELLQIRSLDEIGELAKNFHSMSVRLKDSREELERFNRQLEERVTERTMELQAMNQQLGDANRKLMEIDELKSNFLSTVSHELRTPLTSIKAFAEILLDNQGEDQETQLRFLEIINNESERLARLITDLLDLAKIESGTVKWKMELLDMRQVVQRSLDNISSLAAKHGLTVDANMPPAVPMVYGDLDKLQQLVTNLLSNAVKFTNEGGRIEITCGPVRRVDGSLVPIDPSEAGATDFLQVSVCDNGIGIPRTHLKAVFEKFHQVESFGTRKRGGGTGLGLAICKEIVEHHQGDVWVESEINQGSTFSFTVPIAVEQVAAEPVALGHSLVPAASGGGPTSRKKVLIVDDEPNIRELLKYELTNEGYDVIEAATGEETIEIARRERPSMITLDVVMPGIDGFDILSILNHDPETADIPVILVTVVDDREKGFRLGAVDYVVKPIDRKEFIESIRRVSSQLGGSSQQTVLVVEDDRAINEALQTMLRAEGFDVVVAYDGETAIDQTINRKPDLIVLDLKLPGISGYEVMRRLKTMDESKSTPIVVTTASDLGRGKTKSLALGASEYLTKPFPKEKFLEILKGLLAETKLNA